MYDGQTTEMEVTHRWKDTYKCTFRFTNYPFEIHSCHFNMTIQSPKDRAVGILTDNIQYDGSRSVKQFEMDYVRTEVRENEIPDHNTAAQMSTLFMVFYGCYTFCHS